MLREYYLETPSLTFNEIAKKMNVTRERVRQIKNKALDKLRRVIVTDLRDKQEIISVNFESITKGKCLKFKQRFKGSLEEGKARNEVKDLASDVAIKTEANLEEIQTRKNPMNLNPPSSQSIKTEVLLNFEQGTIKAKTRKKVAEKSSKPKAKREASSTTVHPKVVNNSAEKISETKETVKNKKKGNQSKVKRKSSAKSKLKKIPSKSDSLDGARKK